MRTSEHRDTAPATRIPQEHDAQAGGPSPPQAQAPPGRISSRSTRQVGRRSVLTSVAVTSGTACLGLLQAAPARAADPEVTIEAGGDVVEVATTDGTVLSATYTTPELAEGQMLTLPVTVEARDLDGPLGHLEPAVVTVSSPEATGTQRSTGRESASRVDDAYDEATRLRYGAA